MRKATGLLAALTSLTVCAVTAAYADTVVNSQEISSATATTTIATSAVRTAQAWGLTLEEWSTYQQLMQGPSGQWYPQLSPTIVLGMYAKSLAEQRHFAQLVAKEQHDKLARELAFMHAVQQALAQQYADEPLIQPFDLTPFNPLQAMTHPLAIPLQNGDQLVLFTDTSAGLDYALPKLLAAIKTHADVQLAIFCVGQTDDSGLRAWAIRNQIPIALVEQGRITLNHDNGKLQKTLGQMPLPTLLLVRQGESQPINVEAIK